MEEEAASVPWSALSNKPFSVQYTDRATGEVRKERPEPQVTVDGEHVSLVLNSTCLATLPSSANWDELWQKARYTLATRVPAQ